jgi:hypothetical protein
MQKVIVKKLDSYSATTSCLQRPGRPAGAPVLDPLANGYRLMIEKADG